MGRALGVMLTGLVLLVLFGVGAVLLDDRGAEFEARGTRVSSVVVKVLHGTRGALTADVRYRVADAERERQILLDDTYANIRQGDQITVIYDPSDPDEVAAPGIPNDPVWAVYLMTVLVLGGLSTFIVGVVRLFRAAFARLWPSISSTVPNAVAAPNPRTTIRARMPPARQEPTPPGDMCIHHGAPGLGKTALPHRRPGFPAHRAKD